MQDLPALEPGLASFAGSARSGFVSALGSSDPAHLDSFPTGLWVEATYPADGQPANGVTVTFTIHGTAAVFIDYNKNHRDTATAVTGAVYPGQASAVLYAGYNVAGSVTITATAPGYGSITFTETIAKR